LWLYCISFLLILIFFFREGEREREKERGGGEGQRENPKQSPLRAWSLTVGVWGGWGGLDLTTPSS